MNIIKPDSMPRLWWLNPWAAARYLHSAATALKDYADQADRCIEMQIRIIEDKNAEIEYLRQRVADLNDAVISGKAIIPDAKPNE